MGFVRRTFRIIIELDLKVYHFTFYGVIVEKNINSFFITFCIVIDYV